MSGSRPVVINEFVFNHTSTDTREYVELRADPNTDLGSYRLIVIEGDSGNIGTVDRVVQPGTTDAAGYWATPFGSDAYENGTQTLLLVSGWTGSLGADLDTDDDGVLDVTPWTAIVDAVAVSDGGGSDRTHAGPVLAGSFDGGSFTPGGASRIPDGTDTDSASDWVRNDFDLAGIPGFTGTLATGEALNTPGAANSLTPPPAAQVTIADASVAEGDAGTATLTFTVTRSSTAGAFTVQFATGDGTATAGSDYVATSGQISFTAGGAESLTISVTVNGDTVAEGNETLTVTLSNLVATLGEAQLADATATGTIIDDEVPLTEIAAIQGAGHRSAFVTVNTGSGSGVGQAGNSGAARVNVEGVVTAVTTNGFWMQDPTPDADDATSDGIFVFTGTGGAALATLAGLAPGETVRVLAARVDEFRAGTTSGANNNLTVTQLNASVAGASVQDLGGSTVLDAVLIGPGGRLPPNGGISDPGFADFDPATDAIDFWESLEGMLVRLPESVAVSTTASFRTADPANPTNAEGPPNNEIWVVVPGTAADDAPSLGGAPLLGPNDPNPERIQLDDLLPAVAFPAVDVGARLGPVTGVVNYDFQNYEILLPTAPTVAQPTPRAPETTALARDARQLTIATYNVENLDPEAENTAAWGTADPDGDGPLSGVGADGTGGVTGSTSGNSSGTLYQRLGNSDDDVGSGKYADHARHIAVNLGAPVIVALQEIQDSDGAEISSNVDAARTLQVLVDLIQAEHGITYAFAYANPPGSNLDGGQPNANIRPAYLYRPDLVTLLDATPDDPATMVRRITDPDPGAADGFAGDDLAASRKPLEARFAFNGVEFTLINNHFNSKGGDNALFGNAQPPVLTTEAQRIEQARIVNDRVDALLAADPGARVVVLGDLNDFAWSAPFAALTGAADGPEVLVDLVDSLLPPAERYSYNFQGNAQSLDHILASSSLMGARPAVDVVRVNADFADGASDHDPILARFDLRDFGEALAGTANRDVLDGLGGNDSLSGGGGDDLLRGGQGDDSLDGEDGFDRLFGGAGNDVYRVSGLDRVLEYAGEGIDTMVSEAFLVLRPQVENGVLEGSADVGINGNELANMLTGNGAANRLLGGGGHDSLFGGGGADNLLGGDGNDLLDGGAGRDRLVGGAGADRFVFGTGGLGEDMIRDFDFDLDSILIRDATILARFGEGRLDDGFIQANARGQATVAGGIVVYETDSGRLWYDADGAAAGRQLIGVIRPLAESPFEGFTGGIFIG